MAHGGRPAELHDHLDPDLRWQGQRQALARLVGNDGTFSLPVTQRPQPLGGTVDIPVKVKTSTPGVHSAILEIDDPATSVVDKRVLLTVVLSQDLAAPRTGVEDRHGGAQPLPKFFVSVPAGAKALQVNLGKYADGSQVRWIAYNPYGNPVESTSSTRVLHQLQQRWRVQPHVAQLLEPTPGIWELQVEARRTSPMLTNPFEITASAQGVAVNPATQTIASAKVGVPPRCRGRSPTSRTRDDRAPRAGRSARPSRAQDDRQPRAADVHGHHPRGCDQVRGQDRQPVRPRS